MTNTKYEIRTVHDFSKVPEASREVCLREFLVWLRITDRVLHAMMVGIPIQPPDAFVWIDDDKHEVTIGITDGQQTIHVASGVMRGFE